MNQIPTTFQQHGRTYTQIKREGLVVLCSYRPEGSSIDLYEVAVLRHCKAREIAGKPLKEREEYPSPAQWGTKGWSFCSLRRAEAKYAERLEIQRDSKAAPITLTA